MLTEDRLISICDNELRRVIELNLQQNCGINQCFVKRNR